MARLNKGRQMHIARGYTINGSGGESEGSTAVPRRRGVLTNRDDRKELHAMLDRVPEKFLPQVETFLRKLQAKEASTSAPEDAPESAPEGQAADPMTANRGQPLVPRGVLHNRKGK